MTMFSLMMAISGGLDWSRILDPLIQISPVYRLLFTFYIVFVVFGVLNVLTGVFLEATHEMMDRDLVIQDEMNHVDSFVEEMSKLFEELDTEHVGTFDIE